jgi:hypothetical protein
LPALQLKPVHVPCDGAKGTLAALHGVKQLVEHVSAVTEDVA